MKGLEALENVIRDKEILKASGIDYDTLNINLAIIEQELKALEIVKPLFRLKGNCLQIYCTFADNDDKYMFVKEIETEEEYNLLKEVLL